MILDDCLEHEGYVLWIKVVLDGLLELGSFFWIRPQDCLHLRQGQYLLHHLLLLGLLEGCRRCGRRYLHLLLRRLLRGSSRSTSWTHKQILLLRRSTTAASKNHRRRHTGAVPGLLMRLGLLVEVMLMVSHV